MDVTLNTNDIDDYRLFCKIKRLPTYQLRGHLATFPDEYAERLGMVTKVNAPIEYHPLPSLFDYQRDIVRIALRKRRFSVFADCGLGKTLIFLDWIRHVFDSLPRDKSILIVSPLMVIDQTIDEAIRWFSQQLHLEKVSSKDLAGWLDTPERRIGITNYDALTQDGLSNRNLGGLVLDESSMLKSHYGKWSSRCLELGAGIEWKMACTGTPAPNDRIEYANHAVFMDAYSSVNGFLASFFVNRGQTNERWVLKDHALMPFYRALSHWCVFLTDPAVYGWEDNSQDLPPIVIHEHDVSLTSEQTKIFRDTTGELFANRMGGIGSRGKMGQLAKGSFNGEAVDTNKHEAVKNLVETWPDESTIVWCLYNREQDELAKIMPDAASISGSTPLDERMRLIGEFKRGDRKVLITKPKILGFGLNLQVATRQVFAGLQDSYESFYQAVKRSNRYGATKPLNVHIPMTDLERPMVDNVLRKAQRIDEDTRAQERYFRQASMDVASW